MTVLIDTPLWPAHGRLWAHLVSDRSLGELHDFAAENGIPARGFDLDHYDVPEEMHDRLIAAGATYVSGGELVRRLISSGLRVRARDRSVTTVTTTAATAHTGRSEASFASVSIERTTVTVTG